MEYTKSTLMATEFGASFDVRLIDSAPGARVERGLGRLRGVEEFGFAPTSHATDVVFSASRAMVRTN